MSMVGPRPILRMVQEDIYDKLPRSVRDHWLAARSVALPGLFNPFTASIVRYDQPDTPLQRAVSEIDYVERASKSVDTQIIYDTIVGSLGRKQLGYSETEQTLMAPAHEVSG